MITLTINQHFNLVVAVPHHETEKLKKAITDKQFVNFTHKPMETAPMLEEFTIMTSIRHLPILLAAIDSY
jgi:hypothetical protein